MKVTCLKSRVSDITLDVESADGAKYTVCGLGIMPDVSPTFISTGDPLGPIDWVGCRTNGVAEHSNLAIEVKSFTVYV